LEWDYLEVTTQGHEEVLKPPLVKFVSKILLKILGILDMSFEMHFHELKKMRNLATPSSM
jgi:hypothetical protein